MSNLIIKIFDVGAGLAIYVKTPNGKKIFLDCGGTSELSPAHIINPSDDKISLDYLVISHPHLDHISDIINVSEKYNIDVLRRNKNLDAETMQIENPDGKDNECLKKYFSISDKFTKTVKGIESPENESWGNGCTFHSFNNSDTNLCVNDQSVVTFIDYGHTTIFMCPSLFVVNIFLNSSSFFVLTSKPSVLTLYFSPTVFSGLFVENIVIFGVK